ncbi:glycosyltransferase family 4 protein [Peribacillus frigoritolerans]|uniref:glycosyltransferase family 4 protein n=1 Tax=Peribacillus frigoritolerans TaxID=450367 RepID=UPI000A00B7D5|nr:glycosyltransferase family 4 protein [Peribacillus frigoritolerans]
MKILFVTTVSNTINAFLVPHIKLLIEKGNEVDIACNVIGEVKKELIDLGCDIHNIKFQRSALNKNNYIAYKKLKKLVISEEYDLVHTHTPIASFLTRLACRNINNIKIMYTAHGFHFYKGAPLKNWIVYYTIEKIVAKWTDSIITINTEDYEHALKLKMGHSSQVYKVPGMGVDIERFSNVDRNFCLSRKDFGFLEEDFILVYVAELNSNKNQLMIIEAVRQLKDQGKTVKAILIGSGPKEVEYKKTIKEYGLEKEIILTGKRMDIEKILPICDVAIPTSKREGFGINLVESMASGLPVIASRNRGHKEIVVHGENGYLFELGNLNEMINYISQLYENRLLLRKMSNSARESVNKFSLQNSVKEITKTYKNYF